MVHAKFYRINHLPELEVENLGVRNVPRQTCDVPYSWGGSANAMTPASVNGALKEPATSST